MTPAEQAEDLRRARALVLRRRAALALTEKERQELLAAADEYEGLALAGDGHPRPQ